MHPVLADWKRLALYLAAWLTQRGMYFGDVNARKGIFIDEAWALSTFSTGRRFIDRAARDSRKHNTRVLMASQNPADLLKLDLRSYSGCRPVPALR